MEKIDYSFIGSVSFDEERACRGTLDGVDLPARNNYIVLSKADEESVIIKLIVNADPGSALYITSPKISVKGDCARMMFGEETTLSVSQEKGGPAQNYKARVSGWVQNDNVARILTKAASASATLSCDISLTWTDSIGPHVLIINAIV